MDMKKEENMLTFNRMVPVCIIAVDIFCIIRSNKIRAAQFFYMIEMSYRYVSTLLFLTIYSFSFVFCTVSHVSTKTNCLFYLLRICAHFQFRLNFSKVFSVFLMYKIHLTHSLAQMSIDTKTTEEENKFI